MTYSIKQSSKFVGNNRWQWRAWIDATDSELDQISDVIWYLHESFPKPVVKKTNRKNKFLLKQTGWGVFLLHADVNLKNHETIDLTHQLSFESADVQNAHRRGESKENPLDEQTKIFLSYGAEDSEFAVEVKNNLQNQGFMVLDKNSCKLGSMPLKLAKQQLMRESDLIIGLVTSDVSSPIVLDDLNRAKQSHKAALALVSRDIKPLGLDSELSRISLSEMGKLNRTYSLK